MKNSKRFKIILLAAGLLMPWTSAQAVTVSNCPEEIKIDISGISILGNAALKSELDKISSSASLEEAIAVRDQLSESGIEIYQVTLPLTEKRSGVCVYLHPNAPADYPYGGKFETRLFTRNGKDILRLSIPVSEKESVWTYAFVDAYSTDGIEIAKVKNSRIQGVEDHESPTVTVGWLKDFVAK